MSVANRIVANWKLLAGIHFILMQETNKKLVKQKCVQQDYQHS